MTGAGGGWRSWRRWLGLGLVLYGAAGLALAAAGATLVSASFRGVDRLVDTIVNQRNTIVLTLEATASVVETAASGTESVDVVLADAVRATGDAATMIRSLAAAADEVAQAAMFQILGQRPFADVAARFTQVGADARVLAGDLDTATTTVGGATGDVARVRTDLQTVADQVRQFGRTLAASVALDDVEETFDPPRLVLYGLLAWLGVQAAASILVGIVLIATGRRSRGVAPRERPGTA